MTTIVNTPATTDGGSGSAALVTIVVLVLLAIALLYFGLPILSRNVGTTVQVPDQIDVNINAPQQ